jgi:hypothetical protein
MRTGLGLCIVACAFFGALFCGREAAADPVLLSRFDPADRGSRFFLADSIDLGRADDNDHRLLVATGATSSYAFHTATWGSKKEGNVPTLVDNALWVHPGASVAVWPGARFGLDVPIAAYEHGEDTSLGQGFYRAPASPGLGDIRASIEILLFGPASRERDGISLAGGVTAYLPTGSGDNYNGDDFARFGVNGSAAARYSNVIVALRAAYMYRRDAQLGGSRVGPEFSVVGGAAYVWDGWTIGPELQAATTIYAYFGPRNTPFEWLLGVHKDVGALRFGGGAGGAILKGMGAAAFRGVLSIEWLPGGKRSDRDHDGVPDDADWCPDLPGDPALRGCIGAPPQVLQPDAPRPPMEPELPPPTPGEPSKSETPDGPPIQPPPPPPPDSPDKNP